MGPPNALGAHNRSRGAKLAGRDARLRAWAVIEPPASTKPRLVMAHCDENSNPEAVRAVRKELDGPVDEDLVEFEVEEKQFDY